MASAELLKSLFDEKKIAVLQVLIQDPTTEFAEVLYTRWRFLIGFEFHYTDQLKAKFENKKKKDK